jgi:hypothetical protein
MGTDISLIESSVRHHFTNQDMIDIAISSSLITMLCRYIAPKKKTKGPLKLSRAKIELISSMETVSITRMSV